MDQARQSYDAISMEVHNLLTADAKIRKKGKCDSVDFEDDDRALTCLEVDFPIQEVGEISEIEVSVGKAIYQNSKWWARRRPSVFRAMLLSAATKAPEDEHDAAQLVWDTYFCNHQLNPEFRRLKVADIFMGGGTTIVEGARLGMKMFGWDYNPVAWSIVKNAMSAVDPKELEAYFNLIETEVKSEIMPFFTCECPRGHKGVWKSKQTNELLPNEISIFDLPQSERIAYEYEGPEIIYTFWCLHGPCLATDCNHRTPAFDNHSFAFKNLTVPAWKRACSNCQKPFDVERHEARMAPKAMLIVSEKEEPFTVIKADGTYSCPHCNHKYEDKAAASNGESANLSKAINKKVECHLMVHPDWLKGADGLDENGKELGGRMGDAPEPTAKWHDIRSRSLKLIEYRGKWSDDLELVCPDTGEKFVANKANIPSKGMFVCQAETCGREQKMIESIRKTKKTGAYSSYAIQGFCPECKKNKMPYNGRFFDTPDNQVIDEAHKEWWKIRGDGFDENENDENEDVENDNHHNSNFTPTSHIPFGERTHKRDNLPSYGFTHWWKMFNPNQLLIHSTLLKTIINLKDHPELFKKGLECAVNYFSNQSMFGMWVRDRDHSSPALINRDYRILQKPNQNNLLNEFGRGNFDSRMKMTKEAVRQSVENMPEMVSKLEVRRRDKRIGGLADQIKGKSIKVYPGDPPAGPNAQKAKLTCGSASDLHLPDGKQVPDKYFDMIITDPPFGDLVHYAELSDFFYVWMRLALKDIYPKEFGPEFTPKDEEAVTNRARAKNQAEANKFYQKKLTECWKEAHRVLKAGGLLAFTFSGKSELWKAVLRTLFEARFVVQQTFPIFSDRKTGEGQFGARDREYNVIHVCRKRRKKPESISWQRLRKRIIRDLRHLKNLTRERNCMEVGEGDMMVIRSGKALHHYSQHYGEVMFDDERLGIDAFFEGVYQIIEEDDDDEDIPPHSAHPFTRRFLSLFKDCKTQPIDQVQKHLQSTSIILKDFKDHEWCFEEKKVLTIRDPLDWAKKYKDKIKKEEQEEIEKTQKSSRVSKGKRAFFENVKDFEEAYFLLGACYEKSGISVIEILRKPDFEPHSATGDLLDWFSKHGGDDEMKAAAKMAKELYEAEKARRESATDPQERMKFKKG